MKEWFVDLSMTKKLAIGFGSVLLLTAALAVSGWLSLGDVTRRSSLLEQITSLNESLAELRVSRLQYMLDNGDATSAEAVDRTLAGFEQRLNKILPNFTRPESTALLRQQAEQIQLTRVSLQKMRAAYAAGAVARADMGQQAALASKPIDDMGQAVEQFSAVDGNRYAGLEAISDLRMNWQLVRYQMRGYNITPTAAVAAQVAKQIGHARQSAARVKDVLGGDFAAQVAVTDRALDG